MARRSDRLLGRFGRSAGGVGLLAVIAAGCGGDFDKSRTTPPRGTLGRELFTLICDRVGAQALREDVTGASFHAVCHADKEGNFADKVDEGKLLPLDESARDVEGKPVSMEQQRKNRDHRIARVEALARRRDDLIGAFDGAFTGEVVGIKDIDNPDPSKSCEPLATKSEAEIQKALGEMLGRLTDLYNDDTIPHTTRSLARVMQLVEASPETQSALTRFDARRGYRPTDVAMGVSRPALAYPRIVELVNALGALLSADTDPLDLAAPKDAPKRKPYERTAKDRKAGPAHDAFVKMLAVTREELRTSKALPDLAPLVVTKDARDPTHLALSRPRGNLELARNVLFAQDPSFSIGAPRFLVTRDLRGFAKVALDNGRVPAPFVDLTGPGGKPDGVPDVDELGRFVTQGNVDIPTPFDDFGITYGGRDAAGRALRGSTPAYEYIDVSSTFLASLSRDFVPMLEPDVGRKHETVMDLLAGFYVVAGAREPGDHTTRQYEGGGSLKYRSFRNDASPLLDLVHAMGQVFADPSFDDTLALLYRLAQDKPQVFARLVGVGLRIKEIADKHPEAKLPEKSTLWDEMLDVLVDVAQKPNLVEDIVKSFGEDAILNLPVSGAAYLRFKDHLSYNRSDLNGPPINLTTNRVELMKTPVDRSKADTGENRSAFQKFLQGIHDANGLSVCTKPGAVAHVVYKGLPIDFPSTAASAACFVLGADTPPNPMPQCGIIRFENIARDIVDAAVGTVKLDIRDDCLKKLIESPLTGIVGGADAALEEISGIKGLTTHPTVPGVSRLVFFDLPHDGQPGDTTNIKTRNFLRDIFDPVETLVCPPTPFTDTDGKKLNLRKCSTFKDTFRGRDPDSLFPLEQFGFIEAAKPLAAAFQRNDGNLLFVRLFDVMHTHWGSVGQSPEECDPSKPKSDARWCSQDGGVTYETLVAEALESDLFPAMHDAVRELQTMQIPHCDTRDAAGKCTKVTNLDGVKVLANAIKVLVDPDRNRGLERRTGGTRVTRNDGTTNPQVTPIYLLIDALKGFDQRFPEFAKEHEGDDRLPAWRRGRSQLVDQLFAVNGTGKNAKLANAAVAKALPNVIATLRSQIAANCPPGGGACTWARKDLPNKMGGVVTGPTFATLLDLLDALRSDERARVEIERLLVFLLQSAQEDAQKTTLTALLDMMQVFEDDANVTALLHAASEAAGPEVLDEEGRVAERGLVLSVIELLSRIMREQPSADGRLCSREIDPNRTLGVLMRRLLTSPAPGKAPPLQVLIDVVADVNRRQPQEQTKLAPDDYASIAHEISDFCVDKTRGLEQVYTVIKQATKDL